MEQTHPLFPDLIKLKELSRNSNVTVDLCQSAGETKQLYVIRTIQKPTSQRRWDSYLTIVRELDHPHLLKIEDVKETQTLAYLKMKFMPGGTLSKTIVQHFERQPKEEVIVKWVRQILSAIEYLHSKGIIHRDVNPSNVLLTSQNWDDEGGNTADVVLGDFDDSKAENDVLMTRLVGTSGYQAPEVTGVNYGPKIDIWSLGCLIFELFTRKVPFRSGGKDDQERGIAYDRFVDMSDIGIDFVRKCLTYDPDERPTATALLAHPFLAERIEPFLQGIRTLKKSISHMLKEHKTQVELLKSLNANLTLIETVKTSARKSLFRSLEFLKEVVLKHKNSLEAQEIVARLEAALTQDLA